MIPVNYGCAHVSRTDNYTKNLATQISILAERGVREELIHQDVARWSPLPASS